MKNFILQRFPLFQCLTKLRTPNKETKAMLMRDRTGTNWTGSVSVYTSPFWNWSRTDPNGSKTGPAKKQVEFWICLDPLWTGSKMVLCKQKAYPVRFWTGSVWNRSHVNISFNCCNWKSKNTVEPNKWSSLGAY